MALTNNYMSDAPFMTGTEVINLTFTNKNTDPVLINNQQLVLTEIAHIKEPLGESFYIHLKDAFQNNTFTTDEDTLMTDWIKPTLAWFTRFEIILEIQNQSTSSGFVNNMPEFSHLVTPSDLNVYKQDTYRKAKVMLKAMMEFINDNASSFPEYGGGSSSICGSNASVTKNHGMIIY
jgi:hypothetical protein